VLAPWLKALNFVQAAGFFLSLNVGLVLVSALLWCMLRLLFRERVFSQVRSLTHGDLLMVLGAIMMNAVFSLLGWELWRQGWLMLTSSRSILSVILQAVVLLLVMDLGMYLTHRIAHVRWIYPWLHRTHHGHLETNCLSLFVLSPLEVLGFGALMLLGIGIVAPSEAALTMYLTLNLLVGTLGHAGVRIVPMRKQQLLRAWDTSAFHAGHHRSPTTNFGFYTPVWDLLFGTLEDDRDGDLQANKKNSGPKNKHSTCSTEQ